MALGALSRAILGRSLVIQAAGLAAAAGGTAYYLTHPQRVVAELPADLAEIAVHVHLDGSDGARLHAVWLPGREGADGRPHDRTIVHLHGFNSSGGVVLARQALHRRRLLRVAEGAQGGPLLAWPLVRAALKRRYNVLLVDVRGHGMSAGPWDTSGVQAVADAMDWSKWLREEHAQLWTGLWGNSFGAAVGLALAIRPAGGGFDAMVLDSPVVTARGVYSGVLRRPWYWAIQPVIHQVSNKELLRQLETEHSWMPILLIHGQVDRHVPAWQSQHVYDLISDPQAPERVQLWLVPGADHLEGLEVAQEEYISRTLAWFDRWM